MSPPLPPTDAATLTRIVLSLRERVDLPERTRYRLVGVGLGGFVDRHDALVQPELFAPD